MTAPLVGLSLQDAPDFLYATLPLFEAGEVDLVEHSFDTGWTAHGESPWLRALVDDFAAQGRLLGHGVHFSALSADDDARQTAWLELLRAECGRRAYLHLSEHFGFMTAGSFHAGPPLPVPLTNEAIRLGQDRLRRMHDIADLPVGLENLGFAFGPADVAEQGRFLREILEPVGGFLLLDLHNLYCQSANFGCTLPDLLHTYPLDLVREIHLSGGSWSHPGGGPPFRRDTHDDRVPQEILGALPDAIAACPQLRCVILERLGGTLPGADAQQQFRAEFQTIRALVARAPAPGSRPPCPLQRPPAPVGDDAPLRDFQTALLTLLDSGLPVVEIHAQLQTAAAFRPWRDYVAAFDLRALETACTLLAKWGRHTARNPADWHFLRGESGGLAAK